MNIKTWLPYQYLLSKTVIQWEITSDLMLVADKQDIIMIDADTLSLNNYAMTHHKNWLVHSVSKYFAANDMQHIFFYTFLGAKWYDVERRLCAGFDWSRTSTRWFSWRKASRPSTTRTMTHVHRASALAYTLRSPKDYWFVAQSPLTLSLLYSQKIAVHVQIEILLGIIFCPKYYFSLLKGFQQINCNTGSRYAST